MTKLIKLSIIFLLIFNVFSVCVLTVSAAEGILPDTESGGGACPPGYDKGQNGNCGNYSLNDMVSIALKISEFILGIVGSLALLAFIYGGIMWMISAGDAEKVMIGKRSIIGAVVGLAIVFTSFMIIQLVYSALGIEKATKNNAWSIFTGTTKDWFQ